MVLALGSKSSQRWKSVASALLCTLVLAPSFAPKAHSLEPAESVRVIVQSIFGASHSASVVSRIGGQVTHSLPIVDGVAATVPADAIDDLLETSGVNNVTPDLPISFEGGPDSDTPQRIQRIVRADRLWSEGVTGRNVTVALIDTGVYAEHPDLQSSTGSRVVHCEDFSHESGTAAHCKDTFGHGTFMAGLIAGNGASSNGRYTGAAPEANVVSVKAAGFDGSTDVSTILAGIQWVVSHKDAYNIRALNLSLGSDSPQDYRLSPLNYAVERAWNSGIVVVVSSGNSGPGASTVMKPGDDPYVVTVGASNDEGTLRIDDDRVPVFSSRGPTRSNGFAKPDLVSPGVHTVSLRSPGSAIDQQFGTDARVGTHYFKGTGTSMATATVTGVVAQILQAQPGLNPNQVKYRLTDTARPIADIDPYAAGHGIVDAYGAARSTSTAEANQGLTPSAGLGSLQADRGSLALNVQTPMGEVPLLEEYSAQTDLAEVSISNPAGLSVFSSATFVSSGWDLLSWDGTNWKTDDWTGTNWKGTNWKATVWDGTNWDGTNWKNEDWTGTNWKSVDWDGTNWKATNWQSTWYAAAWD